MPKFITALLLVCASAGVAYAQPAPAPDAIKDLAPTGKLRAAMNFGNPVLVQKGPNGEARGVTPELATALAKRLGVPVEFVFYTSAGRTFDGAAQNAWDIGFIAIEPARATDALGSEVATPEQMTAKGFAAFIARDYEEMHEAAKLAGIQPT